MGWNSLRKLVFASAALWVALAGPAHASFLERWPAFVPTGDPGLLLVWREPGGGGAGQRFEASGTPGGAFKLKDLPLFPEPARTGRLSNGGTVTLWEVYEEDGDSWGVFARLFDPDGLPRGQDFQVNLRTAGAQQAGTVAASPRGGFLAVWESDGQDGDSWGVFARLFDGRGRALTREIRINQQTLDAQRNPTVAALPGGGFLVVWESFDPVAGGWGLRSRILKEVSPREGRLRLVAGPELRLPGEGSGLLPGSAEKPPVGSVPAPGAGAVPPPAHAPHAGGAADVSALNPENVLFADGFESGDLSAWQATTRPPIPLFSMTPEAGPAPLDVVFDASASSDPDGAILTYVWDFDDGSPEATGVLASHRFLEPGPHQVRLRVMDISGATAELVRSLDVQGNQRPEARFEPSPPSGPAPLAVTFDASESTDPDGTITSFSWDLGDGTTASGPRVEHAYAAAGTYGVLLTVTDDGGRTETVGATVTVELPNDQPVAMLSVTPPEGEAPHDVQLDASASFDPDGTLASFAWDLGDGTSATGATAVHSYAQGGDYAVTLTVTDDRGASSTARGLVRVIPQVISLVETSPEHGEGSVAQTRETFLRFNGPLDPASVTAAAVEARFAGEALSARLHLSPDGRTLTLFYANPLPPSSRVRVTVRGDLLRDTRGRAVDADGDGAPGGVMAFDFDTLSLAALPETLVCGRVLASEPAGTGANGQPVDVPLPGVTITVDGMEGEMRAVTAADGTFCLNPAPAGRFFVHVDGATATAPVPAGAYYPTVGKAWESAPGQRVEVGNIFLPLIPAGALQPVSTTEDREITFLPEVLEEHPELEGVMIMVPADSLFSENGSRGGMVGIAPVPPDRIPGPLPEGLDFPIVITVQTDGGANFDRPAPVCFPNLPSPATDDKPLPPGAKSALWSFNHDTGNFEVVGPMTVTDDGRLVCTDPGVGVEAPGWHGSQPGSGGSAPPPRGDGDPEDEEPDDPCEGPSTAEIAETVFDVGAEAVACAQDLFQVRRGVRCLTELAIISVQTAQTLRDAVISLGGDPPQTTAQQIQSVLAVGMNQKNKMEAIIDCISEVSPIPVAERIFNCVGNALSAAVRVCDAVQEDDPEAPAECQPSPTARLVCEGFQRARNLHSEADALLKIAKAKANEVKTKVVCALLVELEIALDDLIANPRVDAIAGLAEIESRALQLMAKGDRQLTPEERDELVAILERTAAAFDTLASATAEAQDLLDGTDSLADQIYESSELAGQDVLDQSDPRPGQYLYLLELPDLTQRGQTDPGGGASFLMPPDAAYRYALYDPRRNRFGESFGRTAGNGERTDIAPVILKDAGPLPDGDGDGLADAAEAVAGTNAADPDTDDDGVSDRAELEQGTNPVDGRPVATGIVATVDTPGTAVDVCAVNGVAALADSSAGVSLVEVPFGRRPTVVAQVDTPGNAQAVACGGDRLLVADGSAGVAVIDVTDPPAAFFARRIDTTVLGGWARAVAADAGFGYAGLDNGDVVILDLATGAILGREDTTDAAVHDLALAGDELYVLTNRALWIYGVGNNSLRVLGSLEVSGSVSPLESGRKLFVGGGLAYAGYFTGYSVIDVSNPAAPVLVGAPPATQPAIHDLAANGSGLLLATTSFAGAGTLALSLYDATDPDDVTRFLSSFETPGDSRAVAVYEGLAYVADSLAGLQVVNYRSYDDQGVPPTLALSANFNLAAGTAEEGKLARVTAQVTDDVQVRSVDFYLDGRRVRTDGNFPFELRFLTPLRADRTSFTLRARAVDTGGNETWSAERVIALTPDSTAPQVVRVTPANGTTAKQVETVTVYFDEPLDPASLVPGAFTLTSAGPDGTLGTADDRPVQGTVSFRPQLGALVMTFSRALPAARYRATVGTAVTDRRGNHLAAPFPWTFTADGPADRDGDGVTDSFETRLGLDPDSPDTDGDGVPDGLEDADGDGLLNADEVLLGTDPGHADSDGDGVPDGEEVRRGRDPRGREIPLDQRIDGAIAFPHELDRYLFTVASAQTVYLDVQSTVISLDLVDVRLLAPDGTRLYANPIRLQDPGVFALPSAGTYVVEVWDESSTGVGAYAFQVWTVPAAQELTISIGDVVSDGVPGAGAGRIESPGAKDVYRFSATAGQTVYVDVQQTVTSLNLVDLRLFAPDGTKLYDSPIRLQDPGVFTLPATGVYRIEVVGDGNDDGAGPYRFQIWNVPAPQELTIAIGDVVSDGVPGAGAGRIESPGAKDVYRFSGTAGQTVYVDVQQTVVSLNLVDLRLFAPDGTKLYDSPIRLQDPGVFTLPATGMYRIEVVGDGNDDGTGTYRFQIWNVPAADEFTISIGDVVSDGVPGAGAGRIESPGRRDVYRFSGTAGQSVYVDVQQAANSLDLVKLRVYAPDGTRLYDYAIRGGDSSVLALTATGTYRIEVVGDGQDDGVGTYAFQVRVP